jgi:hypothetical protein
MLHRHLHHQDFTLAAIDDAIANGPMGTWKRLRLAVLHVPGVREKIVRVCEARQGDRTAQRHHFWGRYAKEASAAS